MFRLLRLAPSYLLRQDAELGRLHYRANAYEIRRVRRSRRILYGYLIVQVILVLFVFPIYLLMQKMVVCSVRLSSLPTLIWATMAISSSAFPKVCIGQSLPLAQLVTET